MIIFCILILLLKFWVCNWKINNNLCSHQRTQTRKHTLKYTLTHINHTVTCYRKFISGVLFVVIVLLLFSACTFVANKSLSAIFLLLQYSCCWYVFIGSQPTARVQVHLSIYILCEILITFVLFVSITRISRGNFIVCFCLLVSCANCYSSMLGEWYRGK